MAGTRSKRKPPVNRSAAAGIRSPPPTKAILRERWSARQRRSASPRREARAPHGPGARAPRRESVRSACWRAPPRAPRRGRAPRPRPSRAASPGRRAATGCSARGCRSRWTGHAPAAATITLSVIRHRASKPDQRIGSMFFNPGGPGVLRRRGGAQERRAARPDRPGPLRRRQLGPARHRRQHAGALLRQPGGAGALLGRPAVVPTTVAAQTNYQRKAVEYGRRCAQASGDLLKYISAADTVRDMDHLRRLVGDRRLTYYGWSYGTFLGQTYANMFPHRVRAMVIDGVVDARPLHTQRPESPPGDSFVSSTDPTWSGTSRRSASVPVPPAARSPGTARSAPASTRCWRGCRRAARFPAAVGQPAGKPHLQRPLIHRVLSRDPQPGHLAGIGRGARGGGERGRIGPVDLSPAVSPARSRSDPPPTARSARTAAPDGRLSGLAPGDGRLRGEISRSARQRLVALGPGAAWPVTSAHRYTGPWNATTPNPVLVVGTRLDRARPIWAPAPSPPAGNAVLLTHDGYGHISPRPERLRRRSDGGIPHRPDHAAPRDRLPVGPPALRPGLRRAAPLAAVRRSLLPSQRRPVLGPLRRNAGTQTRRRPLCLALDARHRARAHRLRIRRARARRDEAVC